MSELALAAFAAETGSHARARAAERAFRCFRAALRRGRGISRGSRARAFAGSRAPTRSFPPLLRAIHDPPPGLFSAARAEPELLARPAVAIVGARSCSPYGAQVARMLGRELGRAGLVVVSGLARGVDGEAHRGALEAGGATVARARLRHRPRLPGGASRARRADPRTGLVVSEYAPGVEPAPWRFPARNRIIAGLAAATVVVEARERSGALITADLALEEGREVFAVPGEITSALSAGTNELLKLGATPLTTAADVLDVFGLAAPRREPVDLGSRGRGRARSTARRPGERGRAARATGLEAGALAAALTELELAGVRRRGRGCVPGELASRHMAESYWLAEPAEPLARVSRDGRPDVVVDRRRRHGLLVRAHAR